MNSLNKMDLIDLYYPTMRFLHEDMRAENVDPHKIIGARKLEVSAVHEQVRLFSTADFAENVITAVRLDYRALNVADGAKLGVSCSDMFNQAPVALRR